MKTPGEMIELVSEMPMVKPGEMPTDDLEGTVSENTLEQDYTFMFSFTITAIGKIDVYMEKNKESAIGVSASRIDNGYKFRHAQLFRVYFMPARFKHPSAMTNILQVKWVATHSKFRRLGLASSIYYMFAKQGFTVVSDYTQYERAVDLWKSISEEHHTAILDVNSGKFLGKDGKVIEYDGHNIPDDQIWKASPDVTGMNRLLVLVLTSD